MRLHIDVDVIADLFYIKAVKGKGKGIFAKEFIPKGTILYFYPCSKCGTYTAKEIWHMTKKQYEFMINHEVLLKNGVYSKFCDKRLAYINHSCNANMLEAKWGFTLAVKDIRKGEEATEDYRQFKGEESISFPGGCKCGGRNCMGNTTFKWPPKPALAAFWNKKISSAMKRINKVKQPLRDVLTAEHPELSRLFTKRAP